MSTASTPRQSDAAVDDGTDATSVPAKVVTAFSYTVKSDGGAARALVAAMAATNAALATAALIDAIVCDLRARARTQQSQRSASA